MTALHSIVIRPTDRYEVLMTSNPAFFRFPLTGLLALGFVLIDPTLIDVSCNVIGTDKVGRSDIIKRQS